MAEPYRPRCMHLSCRSIQMYGEDFESDPEYQAGMVDLWCSKTMQFQGPDDGAVSLEMCSNPERPCFQEF
jgi:hypothetical protein